MDSVSAKEPNVEAKCIKPGAEPKVQEEFQAKAKAAIAQFVQELQSK